MQYRDVWWRTSTAFQSINPLTKVIPNFSWHTASIICHGTLILLGNLVPRTRSLNARRGLQMTFKIAQRKMGEAWEIFFDLQLMSVQAIDPEIFAYMPAILPWARAWGSLLCSGMRVVWSPRASDHAKSSPNTTTLNIAENVGVNKGNMIICASYPALASAAIEEDRRHSNRIVSGMSEPLTEFAERFF